MSLSVVFGLIYGAFNFIVIAVSVFGVAMFHVSSEFNDIRDEAMAVAIATSSRVDVAVHETLINPSQEDSEAYQEIHKLLANVVEANPKVDSVYTMRPTDDPDVWQFIVDSVDPVDENEDGVIDPDEDRAHLGEPYDVSCCADLRASLTGPNADREITIDKWGQWISGYAPLVDEGGSVVGIVGVDFSAGEYYLRARSTWIDAGFAAAIAACVSALLLVFGVERFRKEDTREREELEIRADELDREVRHRTAALEKFGAMIVHELRAPLTTMRWVIGTLIDEPRVKQKELHETLQVMDVAADSMLTIVNDFLDASKGDLGTFEVHKKRGNLNKVLQQMVDEFLPQANAKKINLVLEVPEKIPAISFDELRIKQLLRNLLSNAIKYTDQGSVKLQTEIDRSHRRLFVKVQDTGIGISRSDQTHLFELFTRVGTATAKARLGTGLGLYIAKTIALAHGGDVGVDSKLGTGSTFWFELPLK